MKIFLLLLVVACCPFIRVYSQTPDKELIKGFWLSDSDSAYVLQIDPVTIKEYYNNEITDTFNYTVSVICCDTVYVKQSVEGSFLFEQNEEGSFCYEIAGISKEHLSLIYTTNGRILTFKRRSKKE